MLTPKRLPIVVCCLLLMGCVQVFKSYRNQNSTLHEGVAYYLPRNDVKIVLTSRPVPEEIAAKKKALVGVTAEQKKAEAALEAAQKAADKDKADAKLQEARSAAAEAQNGIAQSVAAATQDLAAAETPSDRVVTTILPATADTRHAFLARHAHWWQRDDEYHIKVDADGLLQEVTIRSEDRTKAIIEALVSTAAQVARAVAVMGLGAAGGPKPPPDYYYEVVIDPADWESVARANDQLVRAGAPFVIGIDRPLVGDSLVNPDSVPATTNGLLYRRALSYTIRITAPDTATANAEGQRAIEEALNKSESKEIAELAGRRARDEGLASGAAVRAIQVSLPNGGPIFALPLEAGPFTESKYAAAFQKGMLVSIDGTRPSEVLGFALIPLSVATIVADSATQILTQMVQLRLDFTNQEAAQLTAERTVVEAQEALDLALEQAAMGGTPAPTAP